MITTFHSNRTKLKPGSLPAVEAWAAGKLGRRDQIAQTLTEEGIDLEIWILEEAEDGDYLISLIETDDYERAVEIYQRSTHETDAIHRKFMTEHTLERRKLRVLSAVRPK
jgi:hypothetical protein